MPKPASLASQPATTWRIPQRFIRPLFALWAGGVFLIYLQNASPNLNYLLHILDELAGMSFFHAYTLKLLKSAGVAVWLVWVAFQMGNAFIRRILRDHELGWPERWSLGLAAGYGGYFLLMASVGAASLWYPSVLWASTIVCGLLFGWRRHTPEWQSKTDANKKAAPWKFIWIGYLVLLSLLFLLALATPEVFYDTLYYHIAVPNLYRIAHRIYNLPSLLFSNFVLTIQLVYGLAVTLGTEITAKLIHGSMGMGLAAAFFAFEKRWFSKGSALLSCVLFFSIPLVGMNLVTTGTDVGWSFLHVTATYALLRGLLEYETRWLVLAGLLTGLSASCKYPGLPYIPLAGILLVWHLFKDQKRTAGEVLKGLLLFGVPALAMLVPMLIRNVAFHSNPLYPFGGTQFGTPRIDPHYWATFIGDANTRVLKREFQSVFTAFHFVFHPWFITMTGRSNSDFIGPLYLMALPLLFLLRAPSPAFRLLRRYVSLLWLLWMCSTTMPRYGLPALALAVLLLAEALVRLTEKSKWRPAILGLILAASISNLLWFLIASYGTDGWRVVGGLQSEEAYLGDSHGTYPTPPYTAIAWMNQHLPKNSKVLFAGEARSHYINFPVIPSSVPDPQPIVELARHSRNGADLARQLRELGVTHIFLNFAEAARTEGYGLFPWNEANWQIFTDFWSHDVHLLWKEEHFEPNNLKALYVFDILDEKMASIPHAPAPNPFQRWAPKPTISGTL